MESIINKTLNIIGCGKIGMTLARLWADSGVFEIGQVLNRSRESGNDAVRFIGAGQALASLDEAKAADVWLLATPDDQIALACQALAESGLAGSGTIVFHCSGSHPSTILQPVAALGSAVASVHPVRSFADPSTAAASFAGTPCGIEGNAEALSVLEPAFAAIGAQCVAVNADCKGLYHAAAVFASNYLVTLLDVAVQAYVKAGMAPEAALKLMEPLVRGTVDNVFRLGTTDALTGPIARGDIATAVRQYRAVNAWDDRYGALYKQLGKCTADIAARRRGPKPLPRTN